MRQTPEEVTPRSSVVERAVKAIKENGIFHEELTGPDLAGLVADIANFVAHEQPGAPPASLNSVRVELGNGRGTVKGNIVGRLPFGPRFDIGVSCDLTNDRYSKGQIQVSSLEIQNKSTRGFLPDPITPALVRTAQIAGEKMKPRVNSETQRVVVNMLESKGVYGVTKMNMDFTPNKTLDVLITREATPIR